MNDPTHTPPHDPRRLTGDQAKAPEPFKLTTQVGTVDLVLLDNEGEPHKIGEAEVVQGHITAHIDDADAVRYLSGGTISLDRLDLLAEHSYPVEPILVHAPEGQIRVGHTCDMPGGLQITITDRAMRGPMMAALAEIKTAALEGREPLEHNVAGGFTPRTEVSEVGPATFDSDPIAAAIEWCLTHAGRGLAAELAQDAARHLREKWATRVQNRVRCEPLAYAISTALHVGAETAIAWADGQDRKRVQHRADVMRATLGQADPNAQHAGGGEPLPMAPGMELRGRNEGFAWVDEASHFDAVSAARGQLRPMSEDRPRSPSVDLDHAQLQADPIGFISAEQVARMEGGRVDIGPGPHQLGRRLMTVDDFRTPEEFQIYRAGADRLPQGILPGSWEAHLLKAMAAMASAAVGLHEARMAPGDQGGVDCKLWRELIREWTSKGGGAAIALIEKRAGEIEATTSVAEEAFIKAIAAEASLLSQAWSQALAQGTAPREAAGKAYRAVLALADKVTELATTARDPGGAAMLAGHVLAAGEALVNLGEDTAPRWTFASAYQEIRALESELQHARIIAPGVGKVLREARGGDEHVMAKAITHALDLLGGVSLRELETRGLTSVQAANVAAMSRTTLEELHKRAVAAGVVTQAEPPWQTFEAAIAGMSQISRRLVFVQARLDEAIRQLGRTV